MPSTSFVRTVCIALAVVALGGCASAMRTVEVAQPLSARPTPPQPAAVAPTNGSIFRTAAYRPLFEDQRARNVGDILTITKGNNMTAALTKPFHMEELQELIEVLLAEDWHEQISVDKKTH